MKIRARIQLGIILSLVLAATIALLLFLTARAVNEKSREEAIAVEVVKGVAELKIVTHEYILHPEERSLMQWRSRHGSLSKLLKEDHFKGLDEKIVADQILKDLQRFKTVFSNLTIALRKGQAPGKQESAVFRELQNRLIGELLVKAQTAVSLAFHLHQEIEAKLVTTQKRATFLIVLFLLTLTAVIVGILLWVNRSIARPIAKLEEDTQIIGSGNLDHKVGTTAKDEIGELSRAFDKMTQDLKETTTSIVELNKEIDERKQAEEALQESEERYSALFDRSLDCVFVNNLDGDFIDTNSAALNLLGYKREDVRSLNYASLLSEEQLPMALKAIEEIVETGSQKELLELKLKRRDGKYVHVETKGSLIYRDGKPYAVQGIARDITERKEAEMDRERLLAELEAKNKELESFVYSITHDLKMPLVSLQGFSSLLQRELHDQLDEEGKHYMERIQDNVAHMDSLISDLLELSRIGRVVGPMEEIDVAALLKEIQQDLAVELEEASAELVVQEPLPVVHADPGRIRQVFINLIDNALKFKSQDRPLRIEVGCKEEGGSYRIHVADNGIGIVPQYQEQIFVPFRKLDPKTEGMGIGLALVQKIVESHGGRVWIESETAEGQEGGGATFYLTLPRREES